MLRITHIGGVAVADQDVAMGPHPRWPDQKVAYSGITYVVLENGESGFACDTCGYLRDKIRAVASHLIAHNGKEPESTLPVETLKALIRAVNRAKRDGRRDFNAHAAEDLNRRGIKSHDGEAWNTVRVGRLYGKWSTKIKAPLPPERQVWVEPEIKPAAKSLPSRREPVLASALTPADTDPLVKRMIRIGEKLQDLTAEWEGVVSDVAIALAEGKKVDTKELEELRADAARFRSIDQSVFDKAAKFDAAQSLFGGK